MERSLPPLLGVLINLALSLILLNWLTCKQEVLMGLLLSITFFVVSTSFLIALYRARKKRKGEVSTTEANPDERSLKEQLRSCLQYGDTETADQISVRLMALKATSDVRAD
jgi:hypothetical protein